MTKKQTTKTAKAPAQKTTEAMAEAQADRAVEAQAGLAADTTTQPTANNASGELAADQVAELPANPADNPASTPSVDPAASSASTPSVDPTSSPAKSKKPISSADKVKFVGLIVFFVLMTIAGIFVARYIMTMDSDDIIGDLIVAIQGAGIFGILICIAIQFVQVVVAFIPGEVTQAAIGAVYGTVGGGAVVLVGALVGSIAVFYLVRKLGAPFVQGMIGGKDSKRFKFLHESKNLNSLVFILYLIPGLPKDIFTYVLPLTDIKPMNFFVLSTIARAPAIFATTFVAESIKSGSWIQIIPVVIVFGGIAFLGIFFNQKIMALAEKIAARISPKKH